METITPQVIDGSLGADIYLTQSATCDSTPEPRTACFVPPKKPKKMMENVKLQKNMILTTVLTAQFYPTDSPPASMCVDTGGETSCISHDYLTCHFPSVPVEPCGMKLKGVGPELTHVLGAASLDIPMKTMDRISFTIPVRTLVVSTLDCGLLLGTDTCVLNGFVIDFQ